MSLSILWSILSIQFRWLWIYWPMILLLMVWKSLTERGLRVGFDLHGLGGWRNRAWWHFVHCHHHNNVLRMTRITCEPASVQADIWLTVTPTRPSNLSCSQIQQQQQQQRCVLMYVLGGRWVQVDAFQSVLIVKMTFRGTMVRSEVCNSWCYS